MILKTYQTGAFLPVNFKAFLAGGDLNETRQFSVKDASVITSFYHMQEKLHLVFPLLMKVDYRITWRDQDGDHITIADDEELLNALTEMRGNLKVLYITITKVICNECNVIITALRYKCMECLDYNLCARCDLKGTHCHHMMIRGSQVNAFPPVNFKVFLAAGDSNEARQFTVENALANNFLYMKKKLLKIFPVLRKAIFRVTWRDQDGDNITIAGDKELVTALTEMQGNLKVLYITILKKNDEDDEDDKNDKDDEEPPMSCPMGSRVICDGCDVPITAFRYKCRKCPNYDLCATCEHKGTHVHHDMTRTQNSNS